MQDAYKIIVVSDEDSWINLYIPEFIQTLCKEGHKAIFKHAFDKINQYDFAFLLSFSQLISPDLLRLNQHNLVVHESALPQGKGWSPLSWQILDGGGGAIPITLFEAASEVDSGRIYLQKNMEFDGTELVDELRVRQAQYTLEMCLKFVRDYKRLLLTAREQEGESTYYPRRTIKDSELDIRQSLEDQFSLLRIVDNEKYPAHFYRQGQKYILKIYKA